MKYNRALIIFIISIIIVQPSLWGQVQRSLRDRVLNASKVWEISSEGTLIDLVVIHDTEEFFTLTQDQGLFHLQYLNSDGETIWHVSNELGGSIYRKLHGLQASKNGETIIVQAWDSALETQQSWCFNKNGQIIFSDTLSFGWYYPSPTGKYLAFQPTNNYHSLIIYDRNGNKVDFSVPEELQHDRLAYRFASEGEILVYSESILEEKPIFNLFLLTFPNIQIKWKYELSSPLWLIDINERNCAISEQYIVIQGTSRPGSILLFSRQDGQLIWQLDKLRTNYGLSFSENNDVLVSLVDGRLLYFVDISNGEIINKEMLFESGLVSDIPKFSFSGDKIVLYSLYIEARDSDKFGTENKVKGKYSVILALNERYKIVDRLYTPTPFKIFTSKSDQTQRLIGGSITEEHKFALRKF